MNNNLFAEIEIMDTGDVFSPVFNDIYFSPAGGFMESLHVFAEPNKIPQRFFTQKTVSVFESGFGTGLNFLLTMKLFLQFAPENAELVFTSFEKHPVSPADMEKIHTFYTYLRYESIIFLNMYKDLDFSVKEHEICFSNKKIKLNLIFDDLKNCGLYDKKTGYDAWYLDGFSPGNNPGMWIDDFFEFMSLQSTEDATFSTFTAAGFIRRALIKNGFEVKKIKGFNRKREMLAGRKITTV
jgi:tRNA 5-methylaminomethyl-2-thiouridine biosynthesis bifunctional protein